MTDRRRAAYLLIPAIAALVLVGCSGGKPRRTRSTEPPKKAATAGPEKAFTPAPDKAASTAPAQPKKEPAVSVIPIPDSEAALSAADKQPPMKVDAEALAKAREAAAKVPSILDEYIKAEKGGDKNAARDRRRDLQRALLFAARPGLDKERAEMCKTLCSKLGSDVPAGARVFILRHLERIGRDESVDAVAELLGADEAMVREHARMALQNNPTPAATQRIAAAMDSASDATWKSALAEALGYRAARGRGSKTGIAALMKHARSGDEMVRTAVLMSLARSGASEAAPVIAAARSTGSDAARTDATDAYLLLADTLCDRNDRATALTIYEDLLKESGHLKCAAIIGLGRAGGRSAMPTIMSALSGDDAEARGAAKIALEKMPVDELLAVTKEKYDTATPQLKMGLLSILAQHGSKKAASLFATAVKDADEGVRAVALKALATAGDASVVSVLARKATEGTGSESRIASASLDRLSGAGVDEAIVALLKDNNEGVRSEAARSLAARGVVSAVPELLRLAKGSDGTVRTASLKALAALAGENAVKPLVQCLVAAASSTEVKAADKALLAACRRADDVESCGSAIASEMGGATVEQRSRLLRALGRLGGATALREVRKAVADGDSTIKDAAVRALADWPDASAADDLIAIARGGGNELHKILALKAFVRVIGLPSDRSESETIALYKSAIAVAKRVEEKRHVLAGLGGSSSAEALMMTLEYLEDPALAAEAAIAMVKIAQRLKGADMNKAADCIEKIEQVASTSSREDVRKRASGVLDILQKSQGFIMEWLIAGPYMKGSTPGSKLFDVPFGPEKFGTPEARDVKWRKWSTNDASGVAMVNLNTILRGDNRLAYVFAKIYSPKDQKARLGIGSDDGVKVYVNEKVVHKNNSARGHQPEQDKVVATLKKGWNNLLVKVTEDGGDWAVSVRVRNEHGKAIRGMRVKAQADR